MTFLLTLLAAIFVLGPLIALHEWGHYIVARMCGVKVLTYSIGFGPKLFGWTSKKSGIDYRISALPLRFIPTMTAYVLWPESNNRHDLSFSVPAQLHLGGTGILTCFPSASPFGYALGAD